MMLFKSVGSEEGRGSEEDRYADANKEQNIRKAMEALQEHGLTVAQLSDQLWSNSEKISALIYLVKVKGIALENALQEVKSKASRAMEESCDGICGASLLDDVVALHPWIRVEQLRSQDWFKSHYHRNALKYLVIDKSINPDTAMAEIKTFNPHQAYMVSKGLTVAQIADLMELTKSGQVAAYVTSCPVDYDKNEIRDAFKNDSEGTSGAFDKQDAFFYLMATKHMDAKAAMTEMAGLDKYQARGISRGLTREQVVGLNCEQVNVMARLHGKGLTAEHLRGQEWFNGLRHERELEELMETKSADDAMSEMKLKYSTKFSSGMRP